MSKAGNGDDREDVFDLMNTDCWREVLDNLPDPKDILSVAAASPDLRSLVDERAELNAALLVEALQVIHRHNNHARIQALIRLRHLSPSPKVKSMIDQQIEGCVSQEFDVEPLPCYRFGLEDMQQFIAHFKGHVGSPFVYSACRIFDLPDVAVDLFSQHGRHLRQVKLSIISTEFNILEKIARMLYHLPNVVRLAINTRSYYLVFPEPHPNQFPSCPKLTELKLSSRDETRNSAPMYYSLIRAYGPQLKRLSVEASSFLIPGLTPNEWNTLANLQRLEIQVSGQAVPQKVYETLAIVQWPDFKKIILPSMKMQEQFHCRQNFRATLETVVFDNEKRGTLWFRENEFQALATHATFPKLVELSIIQPTTVPVPQFLQKYFAKVFPNLKRLLILRGVDQVHWRYEYVHHYFELFPVLEEVKVETGDGVYTIYKQRTESPPVMHLPFLVEDKMKQILESLSERLGRMSHIEKLTVDIPLERESVWVIEPVDLLALPPCPNLKSLDLREVAFPNYLDYLKRRQLMNPIAESLLQSYGHQLTELSTNKETFYAEVNLDTWKKLTNLQIFRANLSGAEWSFAFEILSQVRWPQLNQLSFGTELPFTLELLRVLANFKDSLTTFQIGEWAKRDGPRVWIDEQTPVLPNLTTLIACQSEAEYRHNTELWSSFSRLVPNLREIQFVNYHVYFNRLKAYDMDYISGLFPTVNVIKLVDKQGHQMDEWRRVNS